MKNNDSIAWYYRQAADALKYVKIYPGRRGMLNRFYELEGSAVSILHFFGADDFNKVCRIKRAFYARAEQIIIEKMNEYDKLQKEIDALI